MQFIAEPEPSNSHNNKFTRAADSTRPALAPRQPLTWRLCGREGRLDVVSQQRLDVSLCAEQAGRRRHGAVQPEGISECDQSGAMYVTTKVARSGTHGQLPDI